MNQTSPLALYTVAVTLETKSLEVSEYALILQSCSVHMNGHRSYQICLELTSNKIALLLVSLFPDPRQVVRANKDNEIIFNGIGTGISSCPAPHFLGIA